VGVVHESLFIKLVNSLIFHCSLFITTNEFTQNPVKSLGVQGHLLLETMVVIMFVNIYLLLATFLDPMIKFST